MVAPASVIATWLPALLLVLLFTRDTPAYGWNPLTPIESAAKKVGSTVGDLLGVGGFVESATKPTIHNLQETGKDLLDQANTVIGTQLDHAHAVTSDVIAQTDKVLGDKIDKVDHSLAARIVQVNVTADEVVDRGFGRLDRSIGEVNEAARDRIHQITLAGKDLLKDANTDAVSLLKQADGVLTKHIEDVNQIVSSSIRQADQAAAARIEQVDEVAGRRIGNIDVIATKQSLGLEQMLLRLAALIALVAFVSFVLWRLFVEVGDAWQGTPRESTRWERAFATLARGSPRFISQIGLATAGGALFYFLSGYLPRDSETRIAKQIANHKAAMDAGLAAYDFTTVRYESSQLAILDPGSSQAYNAAARKAELLRDVLSRPALLQSPAGIREVAAQITMVERGLKKPDPDILALKGFVQWQVGGTRRDQYEAATLCASALSAATPGTQALLAPLARNYLRIFFHDPYTPDHDVTAQNLAALRAALPSAPDSTDNLQFQHVIVFDALVAQLDSDSTRAYLEMLDAQVDYEIASAAEKSRKPSAPTKDALARRTKHAQEVLAAWRAFDHALETSPWLAGDPTSLAAFTLNDAVLSHALYFVTQPGASQLLPELVDPPPTPRGSTVQKISAAVRVSVAPIRVAWARRYATMIGPKAQDIVAFQEGHRYVTFERHTVDFEAAYVKFIKALKQPPDLATLSDLATKAVLASSELGLFRGEGGDRRALSAILIDDYQKASGKDIDPTLRQTVVNNYQRPRLHLL